MAQYDEGFGVTFNHNDGGATYFMTATGMEDYKRHVRIMGRWRAYLFFARKLFLSLQRVHGSCVIGNEPKWNRLKGWKP
jgi:hypothetical protein